MSGKKVWCRVCNSLVDYRTRDEMCDFVFDDISARYHREVPICDVCGSVLFVPDVTDRNLKVRLKVLEEERMKRK